MGWIITFAKWVYMVAGIVAAYLSFTIGFVILNDIIGNSDSMFAVVGAALFEVIKVCTIILHRWLAASTNLLGYTVKIATGMLRIGFFVLAGFCALAFFSKNLVSPNLETVRNNEIRRITDDFDGRLNAVRNNPEVIKLQADLDAERKIIRGGTFRGENYRDFDARLTEAKRVRDEKIDKLTEEKDARLTEARTKDYQNDVQVRNKTVDDLTTTLKNATGITLNYSAVVLFLTFLVSILIELSIWVAFEMLAVAALSENGALRQQSRKLDEQIRTESEIADKYSRLYAIRMRLQAVKSMGENVMSWFKSTPLK